MLNHLRLIPGLVGTLTRALVFIDIILSLFACLAFKET